MTGTKDKEDPIVSIIKMYSEQNAALIDHLKNEKANFDSIINS